MKLGVFGGLVTQSEHRIAQLLRFGFTLYCVRDLNPLLALSCLVAQLVKVLTPREQRVMGLNPTS